METLVSVIVSLALASFLALQFIGGLFPYKNVETYRLAPVAQSRTRVPRRRI